MSKIHRLSKLDCDKAFLAVEEFGMAGGVLRLKLSRGGIARRLGWIETRIQGKLFYPYDYGTLTRQGKEYLRSIKNG